MATREEERQGALAVAKHFDDLYGYHNWPDIEETKNDPVLVEFHKMLNKKETSKKSRIKSKKKPGKMKVRPTGALIFKEMNRQQKDDYITEEVAKGTPVKEIAANMGYSSMTTIYSAIDRLGLNREDGRRQPKIGKILDIKTLSRISKRCTGNVQIQRILEDEYGIEVRPMQISNYMHAHNMDDEISDMARRRSLRYLVKDGKTIMFKTISDLRKYLGMSEALVNAEQYKKNPRFAVYNWSQHIRGDDKQ